MYDSIKPVLLVGPLEGNFLASFLLGWTVTTGAGICSYPLDTIRRRMMMTSGEVRPLLLEPNEQFSLTLRNRLSSTSPPSMPGARSLLLKVFDLCLRVLVPTSFVVLPVPVCCQSTTRCNCSCSAKPSKVDPDRQKSRNTSLWIRRARTLARTQAGQCRGRIKARCEALGDGWELRKCGQGEVQLALLMLYYSSWQLFHICTSVPCNFTLHLVLFFARAGGFARPYRLHIDLGIKTKRSRREQVIFLSHDLGFGRRRDATFTLCPAYHFMFLERD